MQRTEGGGGDRRWKRESDAVGQVGRGRTGRTRQEEARRQGQAGRRGCPALGIPVELGELAGGL